MIFSCIQAEPHKSTKPLRIRVAETIVSSFNTKFNSDKRRFVSVALDIEQGEREANMKADAQGEAKDALQAVRHVLDPSQYRIPLNNQERRGWERELVSRESKLHQIKEQIESTSHTIDSQFLSEMDEIRTELSAKLAPLLEEVDGKVFNHLRRYVETLSTLEMERSDAERGIEQIQAYLSPMRKLPTELKTYIIDLALEDVSKRNLALVCKEWERIILDTPAFWRRINTNEILSARGTIFSCATPNEYLHRHLKLAKSIELDVIIDYRNGRHSHWLEPICHALAAHGIERWRSLVLRNGDSEYKARFAVEGIFSGKFDSLRSLTILVNQDNEFSSSTRQDFFSNLYPLIIQTAPALRSFSICQQRDWNDHLEDRMNVILNRLPGVFAETSLFGELETLTIPTPLLLQWKGIALDRVEDLGLTYYNGDPKLTLPRITSISCTWPALAQCQTDFVQKLTVRVGEDDPTQRIPTKFPVLEDLTFHDGEGITALIDMVSPNLRRLAFIGHEKEFIGIKNSSIQGNIRVQGTQRTSKLIKTVFQTHKDRLHVAPIDLTFYVHLSPKSTMIVLERWAQVERLKIYWNRDYAFQELSKALIGRKKKGPLVPNLREMHIEMDHWDEKSVSGWRSHAKAIMAARIKRGLPLAKITWTVYEICVQARYGTPNYRYTGGITREEIVGTAEPSTEGSVVADVNADSD